MLLYGGDTAKVYALFLDAPPKIDKTAAPLPDITALLAQARVKAVGGIGQLHFGMSDRCPCCAAARRLSEAT